ncbi:MAG: hypothetical protein ACRCY3_00835 [Sphingorhabdus sp.]
MRRRGLRTAVAKLEAKARLRRLPVPIIFALYADEGGGDIIGLSNLSRDVPRLYGEASLSSFADRARAALGGIRIMVARYALSERSQPALEPETPVAEAAQGEAASVMDFYQSVWLGRQNSP